MYTMKQACEATGLSYETLKFYCNEGLVPNVERDAMNRRVFNDGNIFWIKSVVCMKNCGMGIEAMRRYISLGMDEAGIHERKAMLEVQRRELEEKMAAIQESLDYIAHKNQLYDDILAGREPDFSYFAAK